jgi:LysR family glycine cleavage system transcriptional activator
MLPDLESLRCFGAAAKHLNFRVAARSVGLSPAAFGDRIKRLEELFETRLFDRTTRKVLLTPAGERLIVQARRTIEEAERCHASVVSDRPSPFSLTVGTRYELGMSWLTPALTRLEKSRPERRLHLFFGDTPALLDAVSKGTIDCLISSARITGAGLSYARLHEENYAFVGSRKLLSKTPLSRREHATEHTLLELHADLPLFRYFLDARPGGEVWAFQHTQHLGTIGPVRARVLEGAGVAVLPHYFVKEDLARKRLVRLMPRVQMPPDWFRLVWRKDHPRNTELHALAEELSSFPLK